MSITPLSPQEVRAFRKSMGWTQEQMASELGVAKRTVEGWENREVDPADPTKGAPPLYLRSAMAAMIYDTPPWEAGVEAARKLVEIAILDVDAEHRLPGQQKAEGRRGTPKASKRPLEPVSKGSAITTKQAQEAARRVRVDTSSVPVHPDLQRGKAK